MIEAGEKAQSTIRNTANAYNEKVSSVTNLGIEYTDNTSSIKNTSNAIDSLARKYAEYKKGVVPDNTNISLSDDEYQQYLNISNQLASIFPTLSSGIDAQGNSILTLGTNAASASQELQRLLETQMSLAYTDIVKESDDSFAGSYEKAKEASKEKNHFNKAGMHYKPMTPFLY